MEDKGESGDGGKKREWIVFCKWMDEQLSVEIFDVFNSLFLVIFLFK